MVVMQVILSGFNKQVLNDVSVNVHQGSRIAVIGPNGGKSAIKAANGEIIHQGRFKHK